MKACVTYLNVRQEINFWQLIRPFAHVHVHVHVFPHYGDYTESAQHHLLTATLLNLRLTRELHQKMEEKDQQIVDLQKQVKEQGNNIDAKIQQLDAKVDTTIKN